MADPTDPLLPDTPCEHAFRRIVAGCLEDFDTALAEVMASDDPRGPHKARVALRRLTTALDVFAPILRRKQMARVRNAAKRLFRALGELRDSDVFNAAHVDQPGHKDRLRRNASLRDKVRRSLQSAKADSFAAMLHAAIAPDGPIWRRKSRALQMRAAPLGAFAAGMLRQVWARCQQHGASVSAMGPDVRHDFRKDLKSLRYLSEFFTPLFPALAQEPFRSDFRDIQDALGILNDFAVAQLLAGRKMPHVLPVPQTRALVAAETIWLRLSSTPRPWDGPAASPTV